MVFGRYATRVVVRQHHINDTKSGYNHYVHFWVAEKSKQVVK